MNNLNTAIILCGGRGTRLGNLSKKFPKTLIKVQGKEIMWYILKILKKNNINHIILPLGYKGNLIKSFIKRNKNFNLKIDCVSTGKDSNIGRRIFKILPKIGSSSTLLLNGDAILNVNFKNIYKKHEKKKMDITFLSSQITYPYGTIGIVKNKIKDFRRNLIYDSISTRDNNQYKAFNYSGISLIKTKMLYKYKNLYKSCSNFEQTFFPKIISRYKSDIVKIDGFWHSIDNVKDLKIVDEKGKKNKKYYLTKKLQKILMKF